MKPCSRLTLLIVISVFVVAPLFAQEHAAMSHDAAPTLDRGLGTLHYKVSTSNAEAQRFFDQGLRYVYAFNHEQAARSFHHAAELDPDLALAYWGEALALGPNINMDVDPDREKAAWATSQAALQHLDRGGAEEGCLRDPGRISQALEGKRDPHRGSLARR